MRQRACEQAPERRPTNERHRVIAHRASALIRDAYQARSNVILRALTFTLDMGEASCFAFHPDADDYSDVDQEKDEKARVVAQALRQRLGE